MIALLTIELRIEGAHSLKDKRQVVRSLKDKLRASFNVAASEVDPSDLWQRATIEVVSVSPSKDYLRGLMESVERAALRIANNAGADVTDTLVEYFESGDLAAERVDEKADSPKDASAVRPKD